MIVKREGELLYYRKEIVDLMKEKMVKLGDFTRKEIADYLESLETELTRVQLRNLITYTIKKMVEDNELTVVNGKGYSCNPKIEEIIHNLNINALRLAREINRTIKTSKIDATKLEDKDLKYLSSLEVKAVQLEKLIKDYRGKPNIL